MDKLDLKKRRKKTSREVGLYNRFLWQRYSLAFLFFFNFNWLIFTIGSTSFFIIPLILLIACILGLFEHVKLYGKHDNQLLKTKLSFKVQLIVIAIMLVSQLDKGIFHYIFPFLKFQKESFFLVSIGAIVLTIICLVNLYAISQISRNKDSYYRKVVKVINKY